MDTTTKTSMVVQTIKDFMVNNNYTVAPSIRTNINGYPFITFIDENNVGNNIYFSKAASVSIDAGTPITRELFKSYQIAETINEAGETRIKLISNSVRLTVADLFD